MIQFFESLLTINTQKVLVTNNSNNIDIYIYVILLYIVYARNVYRYAIYMIDNIIILKYRKIF